ncbi:MAG TPA: hypothetical protein VFA18_08065, partial [Gemmataceae bacterium]|nr:hypothetical protein [Gemmataceae bacterium]
MALIQVLMASRAHGVWPHAGGSHAAARPHLHAGGSHAAAPIHLHHALHPHSHPTTKAATGTGPTSAQRC